MEKAVQRRTLKQKPFLGLSPPRVQAVKDMVHCTINPWDRILQNFSFDILKLCMIVWVIFVQNKSCIIRNNNFSPYSGIIYRIITWEITQWILGLSKWDYTSRELMRQSASQCFYSIFTPVGFRIPYTFMIYKKGDAHLYKTFRDGSMPEVCCPPVARCTCLLLHWLSAFSVHDHLGFFGPGSRWKKRTRFFPVTLWTYLHVDKPNKRLNHVPYMQKNTGKPPYNYKSIIHSRCQSRLSSFLCQALGFLSDKAFQEGLGRQ